MNQQTASRVAVFFALNLAFLIPNAHGSLLDQYVKVPNGLGENQSSTIAFGYVEAQTFTVGISGTLAAVGVEVETSGPLTTENLTLEIRNTIHGNPTDLSQSPLLSVTLPPTVFEGIDFFGPPQPFGVFDVSAFQLPVHLGDVLSIVLKSTDAHGYDWHSSDQDSYPPNIYAGGSRYLSINGGGWITGGIDNDQGFATYVNLTPEPNTFVLGGIGALGLLAFARRRRPVARRS